MRKFTLATMAGFAVTMSGVTAHGQTYSVGTNPQGSLAFASGTAVAKVMAQIGKLQFRVAPYGGSSTYLPLIHAKKLDFGFANQGETAFAYDGTAIFKGRPNTGLRNVGVMYRINGTFAVPKDSPIRKISDLKGKRVPSDYTSGRIFHYITGGILATQRMSYDDIRRFPVPTFIRGIDALAQGKVDTAYIPLNSGAGKKAMATMKNGWRYISFDLTPEGAQRMHQVLPYAEPNIVPPKKTNTGVVEPTAMMRVQFYIVTGAHVPEEIVYLTTKTLYNNKKALALAFGPFNRMVPNEMAAKHSNPYHPGAIKFYKEMGLWPPKN